MNNNTEIEQPYVGQRFKSFDAVKKYIEEYGQRNYVKFWIRSSHTQSSLKSRTTKVMNPELKYVCVKFACIFGGEKIRFRGSGIRKSSTYRNLGCPCMINAVIGDDGNHVVLDTVLLDHNHVLCKTLYDSLKKTKKKSQTIKHTAETVKGNFENENSNTEDECVNVDNVEKNECINSENEANNIVAENEKAPSETLGLTQSYLEKIKNKYGSNIKILIVNSNNSDSSENSNKRDAGITESNVNEECLEEVPDTQNLCRLCLSTKNTLNPIFDPDASLKSTLLSFKIMGCASIKIECGDGLPNTICTSCEANLDIAYNFRIKCENSDSFLRKICQKKEILQNKDAVIFKNYSPMFVEQELSKDGHESVSESVLNYQEILEYESCAKESNEINNDTTDSLLVSLTITCPICSVESETYEAMLEHLETHVDSEPVLLTCNMCYLIFPNVKDLHEHMKSHLNKILQKEYSCSSCEMSFVSSEELKTHEDTHAVIKSPTKKQSEVNYLCNVCGKILKTKDRFRSHKNTHEGLRPHICVKCGRGFADRKNMHQHYNVVHLKKPKLECPVCKKKFYTRTKMKSHITMHYGLKPFSCDVCQKTFRLKMNMIKHKKTHSNDRPHKCDKCSAAFIDKNMLKRHSYIHGGIRPYPCPVCGHRFSVKFHLKKHLEKSKCSVGTVLVSDEQSWGWMTQPDENISSNQCLVLYKVNNDNVEEKGDAGETITMNILQDYQEVPGT